MVKWSNDFIHWLETDHFGKEESETPNNHGSFFFNVCRGNANFSKRRLTALLYADNGRIPADCRPS